MLTTGGAPACAVLCAVTPAVACCLQALFCQVPPQNVLTMHDVSNIWRVPLLMQSQDAHGTILNVLGLSQYSKQLDMHQWKVQIADRWAHAAAAQAAGLVGKHTPDASARVRRDGCSR